MLHPYLQEKLVRKFIANFCVLYIWLYMIIKLEILFFTYFISIIVFFGKSFYHWLECWKSVTDD